MEKNFGTRNLYLVGLMGAGKTTIGRQLARRLGFGFVDSDREIEKRTGVSVPTIFEIEGEEGFRKREAQVISDLSQQSGNVIATGGGVVLREENRINLKSSGFVIYLNAPPQLLWERTRHDKNRPLLKVADPLLKLKELFVLRDPLYREIADLVIDGGRNNAEAVILLLEEKIGERWNH